MEYFIIVLSIVILVVFIWAVAGMMSTGSGRKGLYKSLMRKGCAHCNGVLDLDTNFSLEYLNLKCDDCGAKYQIHHRLEMAWKAED